MGRRGILAACVVAVAAVAVLHQAERGREPVSRSAEVVDAGTSRAGPSASHSAPVPSVSPRATRRATTNGNSADAATSPVADGRRSVDSDAGRAAPTPVAMLPVNLNREMVRDMMTDRVALSAALEPVEKTVDGYRMLSVARTASGDLYGLLGLEPGDLIVMVNEQSVHEGDNPLWDLLDREDEVRIWVMRDGRTPRHFTYRFE
jgi:hypothetical protein